jgi:hypothetical protein
MTTETVFDPMAYWPLDNGEEIAAAHPEFVMPGKEVREALNPGDVVKLSFRVPSDFSLTKRQLLLQDCPRAEHLPVRVTGRHDGHFTYTGTLVSPSQLVDRFKTGGRIHFRAENVIAVGEHGNLPLIVDDDDAYVDADGAQFFAFFEDEITDAFIKEHGADYCYVPGRIEDNTERGGKWLRRDGAVWREVPADQVRALVEAVCAKFDKFDMADPIDTVCFYAQMRLETPPSRWKTEFERDGNVLRSAYRRIDH